MRFELKSSFYTIPRNEISNHFDDILFNYKDAIQDFLMLNCIFIFLLISSENVILQW